MMGIFTISIMAHLQAQLSPGDLAEVHAHLEGLLSCTKCHDIGKGVSEVKCLDCHKALKDRIDQNKGYHVSDEVKSSSCIDCHSDHHGRTFDIIRFDESSFDHTLTGYALEGSHQQQECRSCHQPDFISNQDIRSKSNTFLGLENACLSCHDDIHQGTLADQCTECHDLVAFQPASRFHHDDARYPLEGKHVEVACEDCHPVLERNGQNFQQFTDIAFQRCTDCHDDVHDDAFGPHCTECHSEESFHLFKGMDNFDHRRTDFALLGEHRKIDCFACHADGTDNGKPFREFAAWSSIDCKQCHEDVHDAKFGHNCATCHTEESFHDLAMHHTFSHDSTDYALQGEHADLDCKACHKESTIQPIEHSLCSTCHDDYHQREFSFEGSSPDCASCHVVEGFSPSTFTIAQHNDGSFDLEGGHLATPCLACHYLEDRWQFRHIGARCADCHSDIHQATLDQKYYPNQKCEACHSTQSWSAIAFDHNQTNFPLEGKHLTQECNACHFSHGIDIKDQPFKDPSKTCAGCHSDTHHRQFEVAGTTDCTLCHGFDSWEASRFDHSLTAFNLEGRHLEIECTACHVEKSDKQVTYIIYKIDDFKCASCHL